MEKTTKERDQDIVDMLWQRETFYRCNEDGSFSKVDLVNEFYDDIQQELSKAREEGRESVIAELSISDSMEAMERFFREAPIDYDDKCNLWFDFLDNLLKTKEDDRVVDCCSNS